MSDNPGEQRVPSRERKENQDGPAGRGVDSADAETGRSEGDIYTRPGRRGGAGPHPGPRRSGGRSDADETADTSDQGPQFLLRHGRQYETKRCWTGKHLKWLQGLEFERPLERETLEQYLGHMAALIERIKRIEARIVTVAQQPEYAARVQKLRAFRGIDYLTALAPGRSCPTWD